MHVHVRCGFECHLRQLLLVCLENVSSGVEPLLYSVPMTELSSAGEIVVMATSIIVVATVCTYMYGSYAYRNCHVRIPIVVATMILHIHLIVLVPMTELSSAGVCTLR